MAFVPPSNQQRTTSVSRSSATPALWANPPSSVEKTSQNSPLEEAALLKKQAEQMRLDAELMDAQLTLEKIASLERKLNDQNWLERHPEDESTLRQQLEDLNNKILGKPPRPVKIDGTSSGETKGSTRSSKDGTQDVKLESKASELDSNSKPPKRDKREENPIAGYSEEDLELYLPVAENIEKMLSTATTIEKLEAFRAAPELQDHFADKIQQLLVGPMEDMQRIESLKNQYLSSTSSFEKDQLKREIDKLEQMMDEESPFLYSDNVYKFIPDMSEEEIQTRVDAIEALPSVLQALFKKRHELEEDGDLRLAILIEHYESQIQLLDQVRFIAPLPEEMKSDAIKGFNSLPKVVQKHFAKNIGLDENADAVDVVKALEGNSERWGPAIPFQAVVDANTIEPAEYNDIEFVDRSRYVDELIPSIARMEEIRPAEAQISMFCSDILDKSTFTLTSKPERVIGGYYLRGENRVTGDDANNKLVEKLMERLNKSSLKDELQFYYLPDPSPSSDEDLEMGMSEQPLLVITAKDPSKFYNTARPRTKLLVSGGGLLSTLVFSFGAFGMNNAAFNQVQAAADAGVADFSWLGDMVLPTFVSMVGISVVHEAAHRVIAWKDNFEVGLPNFVPSIQLGVTGAITPFKSPPKNFNSLFDFSLAGPLAGFAVSLVLLVNGLGMTASMDLAAQNQLPALPVILLQSSALGAELIQTYLGNGALSSINPETAVLPLHPFAIAGYAGIIVNALSLLPLGHTDGGRISLALFGRRGAFLVKTFSAMTIIAAGLFGFDNSQLLLLYTLFVLLWQRELEAPVLNEVDDLDITRGFVGIAAAMVVAITLIPLP